MTSYTTMSPGTHWSDPAYLFDYFTGAYGGSDYLSPASFRCALRMAKRLVALGAFDSVDEVFEGARQRFAEVW